MKKRVKTKWLKALRSGEYKQGTSYLNRARKFCCLGVLCDLYAKENNIKWQNASSWTPDINSIKGSDADLPLVVRKWSGIDSPLGTLPKPVSRKGHKMYTLANLNDISKSTFKQIANVIEKQF